MGKAMLILDMPESCKDCLFHMNITNNCHLIKDYRQLCPCSGRDKDCPLTPVEDMSKGLIDKLQPRT
jgi:hypothetical protein